MVCASTAMAATAARNRALRGGSKKARAPTGTRSSKPQAAGDAAARVQQQHQAGDVDRRLKDRLDVGARQALAHQDHAAKAEAEVKQCDREEQPRRFDRQTARMAAEEIQAEEHQRHQHPVQIEDPQDAPVEPDLRGGRGFELAVQDVHERPTL